MLKIVRPDGFNFDQPIMSLVDVHSRGVDSSWMHKTAAVLTKELSELRPEAGRTYVHLIALGDSERYGQNRNSDIFTKEANVKYHKTFEKYAKFYKHHKNKPHLGHKIYGDVKCAAHNPEMSRVELIISIDNEAAPDTVEKVASGKDIPVSMSCQVPFDICTICNNKATNKATYCDHITKYAGQVLDDGRVVGMINTQPKFFDISEVSRNADRIAFSLQKVASATGRVVTGAEMAEHYAITAPMELETADVQRVAQLLTKVAMLEEQVSADVQNNPSMLHVARGLATPSGMTVQADDHIKGAVWGRLKSAGVCLPIEDFYRVALGPRYCEVEAAVKEAHASLHTVYRVLNKTAAESVIGVKTYQALDLRVPRSIESQVEALVKSAAFSNVRTLDRRLMRDSLVKGASEVVPYNGPETPAGRYLAREYALYKLAFLDGADDNVMRLAVLQNF